MKCKAKALLLEKKVSLMWLIGPFYLGICCAILYLAYCHYGHIDLDYIHAISAGLIAGSIYYFNKYTDKREDMLSNYAEASSCDTILREISLLIASVSLVCSFVLLLFFEKLNYAYLIFIPLGIGYSLPFFPSKTPKKATRLKQIPFLKSALIAFMWGAGGPLLIYASGEQFNRSVIEIVLICMTGILANIYNNNFCDELDKIGDEHENIPTLPILLGFRNFLLLLSSISLITGIVFVSCFLRGELSWNHLIFYGFNVGLVPWVYIGPYLFFKEYHMHKQIVKSLSDFYLIIFAGSLILL